MANNALFVDFDGTLVAIAPRPQDVHVAPWVVPLLRATHQFLGGALAVITGRPIDQVDHLLEPLRLCAAGSHGAQRRRHDGQREALAVTVPTAVTEGVQALAALNPDLLIEYKPASIAVHYRAAPDLEALCLATLEHALRGQDGWSILRGHMVFEVKRTEVSKATAVRAFMQEVPFMQRIPVAIGDDVTDEAAFAAAKEAGGHGIKVGDGPTIADYRLDDPAAVCRWLHGPTLGAAAAGAAR